MENNVKLSESIAKAIDGNVETMVEPNACGLMTSDDYLVKDFIKTKPRLVVSDESDNFKVKFIVDDGITKKSYNLTSADVFDLYEKDGKMVFEDTILTENPELIILTSDFYIYCKENGGPNIKPIIIPKNKFISIGKNKVYYSEDEKIYVNINEETTKVEVSIDNKDAIVFFAGFETAKVHSEKVYKSDSVPESAFIVSENKDRTDIEKSYIESEENLKKLYLEVSKWLYSLSSMDSRKLWAYIQSGKKIPVDPVFKYTDNKKTTVSSVSFDKNFVLNELYPSVISSVIEAYDGTIELGDDGNPILTEADVKSLSFVGMKQDDLIGLERSSKSMLETSKISLKDAEDRLEKVKGAAYDSMCTLCLTVNTNKFKEDIKTFYAALRDKNDAELEIEECSEFEKSQREGLASLQMLARYQVQKRMDSGEFRNYHTFTSAMLYFTVMKRCGIVTDKNGLDNFGALNAFMNYVVSKANLIEKEYLNTRFTNTIFVKKSESYLSMFECFCEDVIAFDRYRDTGITDPNKQNPALNALIEECSTKDKYITSLSTLVTRTVLNSYDDMSTILAFKDSSKEVYVKMHDTSIEQHKARHMDFLEKDELLIKNIDLIKNFIETNYDKLVGIFREIRLSTFEETTKAIGAIKTKNVLGVVDLASNFIALQSVGKYIDCICTSKITKAGPDGKFVEEDIDKDDVKEIMLKFFIEIGIKNLIAIGFSRLNNDMCSVYESVKGTKSKDIKPFYSASLAMISVCEKALLETVDDGTNLKIEEVYDANAVRTVGKDALAVLVGGLSGTWKAEENKEDGETSRLSVARMNFVKDCGKILYSATSSIVDFLKEILE